MPGLVPDTAGIREMAEKMLDEDPEMQALLKSYQEAMMNVDRCSVSQTLRFAKRAEDRERTSLLPAFSVISLPQSGLRQPLTKWTLNGRLPLRRPR